MRVPCFVIENVPNGHASNVEGIAEEPSVAFLRKPFGTEDCRSSGRGPREKRVERGTELVRAEVCGIPPKGGVLERCVRTRRDGLPMSAEIHEMSIPDSRFSEETSEGDAAEVRMPPADRISPDIGDLHDLVRPEAAEQCLRGEVGVTDRVQEDHDVTRRAWFALVLFREGGIILASR